MIMFSSKIKINIQGCGLRICFKYTVQWESYLEL
jgi:hypothetical protein